jgi:uncharacterized membrane protein
VAEPALETGVSKERTISFSDGVFAVAITLLVLKVEIPDLPSESGSQLRHALDETLPALLSYFIGFYVIGKFWLGHHSLFGKLTGIDGRLLNVNLLYLSLIALLPFPTGVLGEHGQIPGAVAIFAGAVALAGLAEGLLLWTALRAGLAGPELVAQRRPALLRDVERARDLRPLHSHRVREPGRGKVLLARPVPVALRGRPARAHAES